MLLPLRDSFLFFLMYTYSFFFLILFKKFKQIVKSIVNIQLLALRVWLQHPISIEDRNISGQKCHVLSMPQTPLSTGHN